MSDTIPNAISAISEIQTTVYFEGNTLKEFIINVANWVKANPNYKVAVVTWRERDYYYLFRAKDNAIAFVTNGAHLCVIRFVNDSMTFYYYTDLTSM